MIAITRDVSARIAECELTHLDREPIDVVRASEQHEAYRDALRTLGCEVISLPADDRYPDCVFVEDTAIVLPEFAVLTRPGAESRRGEVDAIADALAPYRRLARLEAPATLDGGDVLVMDDELFVGLSSRTNEAAIAQLHALGLNVTPVRVHGALHLKSAVTRVASDTLLVNREWIDVTPLSRFTLIDAVEPSGANAVLLGDTVIYPTAFPETRAKLESRGIRVVGVNASELAKAEGGVTCCSLLVGR
ncbi:MAG TPA: arginine deiminase-related protein [Thermoanaerobaculia bacterium]|nr:arginine deiminase-related protein [Thermoanaerobaculia bacterium]